MLSTGQEGAEEPPRVSQPHVCWGLWPRMLEYAGIGWLYSFLSSPSKLQIWKHRVLWKNLVFFFIPYVFVGFWVSRYIYIYVQDKLDWGVSVQRQYIDYRCLLHPFARKRWRWHSSMKILLWPSAVLASHRIRKNDCARSCGCALSSIRLHFMWFQFLEVFEEFRSKPPIIKHATYTTCTRVYFILLGCRGFQRVCLILFT